MATDGGMAFGVLFVFPAAFVVMLLVLLVASGSLQRRGHRVVYASLGGAVVAAVAATAMFLPFTVPLDEVAVAALWIGAFFPLGVALDARSRVLAPLALLVFATVALRWTFQNTFVDVLLFAGAGGALLFVAGYVVGDENSENGE